MKRNVFASLIVGVLGLMVVSCGAEEDTIAPAVQKEQIVQDNTQNQAQEETPGASLNNISLFANAEGRDMIRALGIGGPMGFVYNQFLSGENGRNAGVLASIREMRGGSSSMARLANECYTEEFTETETSFEYILDFGEGCEIDGVFIKGRIVETGTFTEGTFDDRLEFVGFGGDDWEISGVEVYSGTWSEENAGTENETWEASFTYTAEIVETYVEDGETYTESIVASGEEVWNQDGFTVLSGTESVTSENGDTYFSEITSPLVVNFTCDEADAFEFVSGVESGTYTEQEEDGTTFSGTFSVDYGDGTCDNIISITEDGVTETIDVSDEWEFEEDDVFDEVLDEIIEDEEEEDLEDEEADEEEDAEDEEGEGEEDEGEDDLEDDDDEEGEDDLEDEGEDSEEDEEDDAEGEEDDDEGEEEDEEGEDEDDEDEDDEDEDEDGDEDEDEDEEDNTGGTNG